VKKLSRKHLKRWLMDQQHKFSLGNNLQETELIVGHFNGVLNAEFICRNGLGSVWSTNRWLTIKCPSHFVHLFADNSPITFDL
jgi:hypothetical protein